MGSVFWSKASKKKRSTVSTAPTKSSLSFVLASTSTCAFNDRIKIEVCASLYFQLHAYSSPDKAHKHLHLFTQ